ncbi:MAG TPA: hypothetical protein VGF67_32675 [Ktedonobacteraceae bacterium]|jgi:hypothetical protein
MARLVIFLLTRRWGLLIVGAALIIGGVIWGMTSHQITYQTSQQGVTYHIAMGETSGNVYINPDKSSNYFVAFKSDFTPSISQSDIDNSDTIDFVARTDTSSLDPALQTGGTTINDAHKIEKLIFYDQNGHIQQTFTTAEYQANPNGFNDNEWMKAIWLIIAGAIIAAAALIVPMLTKRPQPATGFAIGTGGEQPYQQPVYGQPYAPQQPANPYAQPYQGPGQYSQGTAYPPQPPAYGQPGNPYQQPPQQ